MQVEQFLTAVLPMQGHRFALCTFGQQGEDDFRPGQKVFPVGSTTDIISYAAWGSGNGANAYFAVGGYVRQPDGAERRTAACAQFHRCLRMDVDVGAKKDYKTKREALTDLLGMVQHFGMPAPWLVDSGGGFHAYWAFDRDITVTEWLPLANRLRAACEAYGLKGDHTTTIDAARILRVPGTLNNKPDFVLAGNPPLVTLLQQGAAAAPEAIVLNLPEAAPGMGHLGAVPAALRGHQSELQQGLHQPYFMAAAVAQCPGLNAILQNRGATAAEPLWKATLDMINKSDDDEPTKMAYAQAVSEGHPGYSADALGRKWQQVVDQDYHPPTCSRMAAAGMPECAACPLRGKISSPLVLGRPVAAAPASDAQLQPQPRAVDPPAANTAPPPPPVAGVPLVVVPPAAQQIGVFMLDHTSVVKIVDGRLTGRLLIADGYPTIVMDGESDDPQVKKQYNRVLIGYRLTAVERMLDKTGERSVVTLSFERGLDGLCRIEFDNKDFTEPKSFFNKMQAMGLYAKRKDVADFVDRFMSEFLTQLQRARAASQIAGRCGWTEDFNSFVLGSMIHHRGRGADHIHTSIAPGEMEGYHSAGDPAVWRAAFDTIVRSGADRQCVLALAIAGPLMAFTGLDGVLFNAYSPESGVGKSTLCNAALSIWGAPDVLRKDFRDTANATFKLAAVTGNMPMVIDEFTNVEGRALSDYVYTITQGREKHRLGADSRLANGQTSARWCLAAIATSNNSVHDKLQAYRLDSTAEAARVFEMRMHPLQIDPDKMGAIKEQLQGLLQSYGHLGPQLVDLFLSKPPEYWRKQVMSRIGKWDREVSTSSGDRFRSACCALIEVGAALGKALGFGFDVDAVEQMLRMHWEKQVSEFEAERKGPADFVNSYIVKHMSEFMMIGGANGDMPMNPSAPRRFLGEIRGLTVNGKFAPATVMIPMDFLRTWVREQNGNYKGLVEWIQRNPAVLRHGRLSFMHGTVSAIDTQAVEFKYREIVGGATLAVVESLNLPAESGTVATSPER